MPVSMDGKLNYRAWDEEPPAWSYLGPFASYMEAQAQRALSPMFMPGDEIRESVRPPLAQVQLFRSRFGYASFQDRQPRVEDVVSIPRGIPANISWSSGGVAGMTGSSRYSMNSLGLS